MSNGREAAVRVASEEVWLRLNVYGWDEIRLLFTPEHFTLGSLAAAATSSRQAMDVANVRAAGAIEGREVELSPFGPVAWIDYITDEAALFTWIDNFAAALSSDGWSGCVGAHPQSSYPSQLLANVPTLFPTAFLGLTMEPPGFDPSAPAPPRWAVTARATAAVSQFAERWTEFPNSIAYLQMDGSQVRYDGADIAEMLSAVIELEILTGLTRICPESLEHSEFHFSPWGEIVAQTGGLGSIEQAVRLLRELASLLDLGIVRPARFESRGWLDLGDPEPPFVNRYEVRANRHLWDQYLPDASGIQLLTDAHLSRADSLASWLVEEVAPRRYLVSARDLRPWLTRSGPDPDVVAAARQDFAGMLLRPEILDERRPV